MTIPRSSYRDFQEQEHTRGRGEEGEAAGAEWLESVRGYRIVERNHTNAAGEIDAIAWDGDVLCFVEIKARSHARHGKAIEAVGPAKQRRLIRVARLYLVRYDDEPPACRFDVLGMDQVDGAWRYTLIQDAFQAGG